MKYYPRNIINQDIQETVLAHQPLITLKARDYDQSGLFLDYDLSDRLNSIPQVLLDTLVVRIGAKLMVTRNLDVQSGIINGTVGILETVHSKALMLRALDGWLRLDSCP